MKPVVAIIGAGAIGCYYGGRLAQLGCPVHFLFRSGFELARERGLSVQSPDGDFCIPPPGLRLYRDSREMPQADLVIVTLKTTAGEAHENLIAPVVGPGTMILTLQNGLGNEERLAERFGAERILGGLAFVCVNRLQDGTIRHLDHGHIKLGEFSGPPQPRTEQLARLFEAGRVRCSVLENLAEGRWEKLVWNVPFNGLGAVLDKSTDQLIGSPHGLALVRGLMREVMESARALEIHLPEGLPELKITQTKSMGAYRTSMQIDRQLGRPLETEAILGAPLRAARGRGVATPFLEMLYDMASLLP